MPRKRPMKSEDETRTLTRESPIEERSPEIIRRLSKAYPEAGIALRASNPLEMLVATILSAQCTDERVNKVTETLFQKYRTPEDYLRVPVEELSADIKPTGFFNQKTASIRGACQRIVEVYGGEVPGTMEDLLTLPGVARKTANIVLGNSFGTVEGIAVDTHVRRVSQRLGFTEQVDPNEDRAGPDAPDPQETVVRLHLRADRARTGHLHRPLAEVPGLPGQRPVPVEPRLSRRVRGSAGDREPVAGTLLRCRFAGSPEPLLTLAGGALLPSTRSADDPPLLLGRPSPHAGVLRRVERPGEALRSDLAAEAHGLRVLDLIEREPRRPDRKEKLRILVEAPRAIQPLHRSAFDLESRFSPEGGRELPPAAPGLYRACFPRRNG